MEFFEVIKKRHCVREFDAKKSVSDGDIEKIIAVGKKAPSAGGLYPTRFTIVKKKDFEGLSEAIHQEWFKDASIVLIVWTDPEETINQYQERGENLYIIQDAAAAAENIFLAVTALGLATCWIGTFDDEKLAKFLKLKPGQWPFVVMPIGYEKQVKSDKL